MASTLFSGGTVVTSDASFAADLLVVDGRVAAIGSALSADADERVDCNGRLLVPGGVDVHTHLDAPMMGTTTSDDFESGTRAAACGGTTTIVDFALQVKGQRIPETLALYHEKAAGRAAVDYGFHIAVTDLYDGAIADLGGVVDDGVTSFKIFMAYRGMMMLDDGEMFEVMREAGRRGAQVCIHAENGDVIDRVAADLVAQDKTEPRYHAVSRPPSTEVEAVRRAIQISRIADAPIYFVHLSVAGSAEAVAAARAEDWPVSAETCTHYLTLGPELYDRPDFEGAKVVLTPPLREPEHREALWKSLRTGALGVVSSDHCPFCFRDQKELGRDDFRRIPNGGPGVEHRMPLMYGEGVRTGRLSVEQYVNLTATTPAKSFGLFPRKGALTVGSDADVVVLDPSGTTTISADTQVQRIDYTPWEGWTTPGRIERVYSRGRLVSRDGSFVGNAGHGRYLARSRL
ncbi:MAG: dihydropyrimidinase [Streptosporangiales bacterium]|nr:dihydropyrimidinase [Streptosporangiales bacterium]